MTLLTTVMTEPPVTAEIMENYLGPLYNIFYDNMTLAFFLRIVCACVCGAVIGYERTKRLKEAGIRTHIIVALGAALFMILSKYSYMDIVGYDSIQLDASRVSSNIVTGISFLCAGVIFIRKNSIRGLTTAAGIWATAAVGMAIGAGMYMLGLFATVMIIVVQYCLHRWCIGLERENVHLSEANINVHCTRSGATSLQKMLEEHNMKVNFCEIESDKPGTYVLKLSVALDSKHNFDELMDIVERSGVVVE